MAEYLPGDIRQRIRDLLAERQMSVAKLAEGVGCDETTLGRFIRGDTKKIGDQTITRIAGVFCVSTDFLLGVTNIPDRKNYDIEELGLSIAAAKNLYTGKVNPKMVNILLENDRFAYLTTLLARYLDEDLSAGVAAQNQLFNSVSSLLIGYARIGPDDRQAALKAAQTVRSANSHPPLQTPMRCNLFFCKSSTN
ncbi:MAG: helix-turn-helix transcriptional regulator [Clostridiales bacterium]|nr:helix-turn-helix transcriptional regulator [Clostridiales bacterium]